LGDGILDHQFFWYLQSFYVLFMILLLFWGHEPCIGFFLWRFNTPDALICYPGSIEKLKLLGATYLLTECSMTLPIVRLQSSCDSSAKLSGNHDGMFMRLPVSLWAAHVHCDTWRCLQSLLLFVWRNATIASRWWYILYLIESLVWGSYHVEWPTTESVRVSIIRSVCQQRTNRLDREWLDEAYERVDGYG
jgi:hypothetical protein